MSSKNKLSRLASPELLKLIQDEKVVREKTSKSRFEIVNRVYDQLKKQKRLDCFDWCVTIPSQEVNAFKDANKQLNETHEIFDKVGVLNDIGTSSDEDFMLSFEYKNKTVLLRGYVINEVIA